MVVGRRCRRRRRVQGVGCSVGVDSEGQEVWLEASSGQGKGNERVTARAVRKAKSAWSQAGWTTRRERWLSGV